MFLEGVRSRRFRLLHRAFVIERLRGGEYGGIEGVSAGHPTASPRWTARSIRVFQYLIPYLRRLNRIFQLQPYLELVDLHPADDGDVAEGRLLGRGCGHLG